MRAEPRSQQGPKPFHRVHVHCMKAITVVIPSVFPTAMTDACMLVTPLLQTAVEVVFIRVYTRAWCHRRLDERLDRDLLDVCQPPDHHVSIPLNHPEDRRLLRGECAPAALALEPSAPSTPPFFFTVSGLPLCPATIETSSHSTSSLKVGAAFFETMLWRH
jgi:hypothetical protein